MCIRDSYSTMQQINRYEVLERRKVELDAKKAELPPDFSVRVATREDFQHFDALAAKIGWVMAPCDMELFYQVDPHGLFIAFLGLTPVAIFIALRHSETLGYCGYYVCDPDYRGKGYGSYVWIMGLEHLGTRGAGLDAVAGYEKLYASYGFIKSFDVFEQSFVKGALSLMEVPENAHKGYTIKRFRDAEASDLADLDAQFFPVRRQKMFEAMLMRKEIDGVVAFNEKGEAVGVFVIRRGNEEHNSYQVGPFYAKEPSLARFLMVEGTKELDDDTELYVDCPTMNEDAQEIWDSIGSKVTLQMTRMFTEEVKDVPDQKCVYGLASVEMGQNHPHAASRKTRGERFYVLSIALNRKEKALHQGFYCWPCGGLCIIVLLLLYVLQAH
eukprot:TRINITY_DN3160_c0_g1_i4.p1 TRINITY_DN3160_c0_g1~~TRINITY_DN3160_c0_g1_i4.p1  ORF type:complete len:384 (-),score=69.60 TRINITY_DN3160_c0_g1_i4:234-1385(-)